MSEKTISSGYNEYVQVHQYPSRPVLDTRVQVYSSIKYRSTQVSSTGLLKYQVQVYLSTPLAVCEHFRDASRIGRIRDEQLMLPNRNRGAFHSPCQHASSYRKREQLYFIRSTQHHKCLTTKALLHGMKMIRKTRRLKSVHRIRFASGLPPRPRYPNELPRGVPHPSKDLPGIPRKLRRLIHDSLHLVVRTMPPEHPTQVAAPLFCINTCTRHSNSPHRPRQVGYKSKHCPFKT